jgi:mono/diheme cytochrome c family protein
MTGSSKRRGAPGGRLALALAGTVLLWTGAVHAGDPVQGRKIAERWCVSCHNVSTEATARDAAPPFGVLARDKAYDRDRLVQVLSDPHPPMPRVHLSRDELADVIAYIESLRPPD